MTKGRWAILAIIAAISTVAGILAKDSLKPQLHISGPVKGAPATQSSLTVALEDGKSRDLAKTDEKLLVLHFWATWCAPCVEEFPSLAAFTKKMAKEPDVEVLAVSVDKDWATVKTWLEKEKLSGVPLALDPQAATAKSFGTEKFPETWFVGKGGRILGHQVGPMDWASPDTEKRIADLRKMAKAGGAS
jgi:thiol-disulfide isomerase/thioredoxin